MHLNLQLGPRGACAALPNCPQACNGFVSENPDGSPKYSVRELGFEQISE
jgi:hypothetical protein